MLHHFICLHFYTRLDSLSLDVAFSLFAASPKYCIPSSLFSLYRSPLSTHSFHFVDAVVRFALALSLPRCSTAGLHHIIYIYLALQLIVSVIHTTIHNDHVYLHQCPRSSRISSPRPNISSFGWWNCLFGGFHHHEKCHC
jgi:hypothetical protein